jgi:hypoxanthine phosphoribosyltransferase
MPEQLSPVEPIETEKKFESIPSNEERQKKIDQIVELSHKPINELRKQIENGDYKIIIGDDASGRVSALIWRDFLNHVNTENDRAGVETFFLAGSKTLDAAQTREKIKAITDYLIGQRVNGPTEPVSGIRIKEKISSKNDKVLIVTDTINSGQSLIPLTQALSATGTRYDIVTNSLLTVVPQVVLESNLGARIHCGEKRTEDYAPLVYKDVAASGVVKNDEDLFATPVNTKEIYDVSSHELLSKTRDLIPVAGAELVDYYHGTT